MSERVYVYLSVCERKCVYERESDRESVCVCVCVCLSVCPDARGCGGSRASLYTPPASTKSPPRPRAPLTSICAQAWFWCPACAPYLWQGSPSRALLARSYWCAGRPLAPGLALGGACWGLEDGGNGVVILRHSQSPGLGIHFLPKEGKMVYLCPDGIDMALIISPRYLRWRGCLCDLGSRGITH